MFRELDSLNDLDMITVCHGVLTVWNGDTAILQSLSERLSRIVKDLAAKYSRDEYKERLVRYINLRTKVDVTPKMKLAGDAFLNSIL